MSKHLKYNASEIVRQHSFLQWLHGQGETLESLGHRIDITRASMSKMYRSLTISTWRWNQLRNCGIPIELLPKPEDRRPGWQPQQQSSGVDSSLNIDS